MTGHVITFYSYKGGTGRTMALANAAVALARDRRASVLAIDWDLEAPGLHRFLDGREDAERPGVIELFEYARDLLMSDAPLTERAAASLWQAAPLRHAIAETGIPGLSIMRAGTMDATYSERVNGFDWEGLYHDAPTLFGAFADTLAARYDYVLIDSRTGITDAGGICTMLLPDRLVLVFTPNRQSLDGVVDLARRATDYRRRSDDLRPLVVFPLASRVELSEEELRREWRHGDAGYQPQFEQLFRESYDLPACPLDAYFDEVQIQHAARFAYGEQIAMLDESVGDRLSLARSYASFTRILVDSAGPWEYRREASAGTPEEHRPAGVLAQLDQTIDALAVESRVGRRFEVLVRVAQAALLVVGLIAALILNASFYTDQYASFAVGGGALLAAVAELLVRTSWPPDRHRSYARTAAALAREKRLYDASAGAYATAEAPAALLAERTDEILAAIDDPVWALHHFRPPPS
jgi:MinD-like ATPase involved in chromosome partitioning or flagellar assembly